MGGKIRNDVRPHAGSRLRRRQTPSFSDKPVLAGTSTHYSAQNWEAKHGNSPALSPATPDLLAAERSIHACSSYAVCPLNSLRLMCLARTETEVDWTTGRVILLFIVTRLISVDIQLEQILIQLRLQGEDGGVSMCVGSLHIYGLLQFPKAGKEPQRERICWSNKCDQRPALEIVLVSTT